MANTDNGQIDYRRRLRDAAATKAKQATQAQIERAAVVKPEPAPATVPVTPPVVPVYAVEPVKAVQPTKAEKHPKTEKHGKAGKGTITAAAVATRTPNEIRTEAATMVEELLTMSDDEYTDAMKRLAVDDAMLYAAVVDAINNADATAGQE